MAIAEVTPLDRLTLKALRTAKMVSFNHTPTAASIRVTGPPTDNLSSVTRLEGPVTEISVDSLVRSCKGDNNAELMKVAYCHELMWVDCGETGMQWRTITTFLKPGDVLSLHWGRDYNTNLNMERHELHGDRLALHVKRGDKKFGFILNSQCSPNNTARMIKRGVFNNE